MTCYDLYGTRAMTVEELRRAVEPVLVLEFDVRKSDVKGSYVLAVSGPERFSIQPNHEGDGDEEAILETRFADYPVLLYVSRTERADEIRDLLLDVPGLDHLRRDLL